jgi:hypothetical protein
MQVNALIIFEKSQKEVLQQREKQWVGVFLSEELEKSAKYYLLKKGKNGASAV